jgi:rRNA maturation protein Nop10
MRTSKILEIPTCHQFNRKKKPSGDIDIFQAIHRKIGGWKLEIVVETGASVYKAHPFNFDPSNVYENNIALRRQLKRKTFWNTYT